MHLIIQYSLHAFVLMLELGWMRFWIVRLYPPCMHSLVMVYSLLSLTVLCSCVSCRVSRRWRLLCGRGAGRCLRRGVGRRTSRLTCDRPCDISLHVAGTHEWVCTTMSHHMSGVVTIANGWFIYSYVGLCPSKSVPLVHWRLRQIVLMEVCMKAVCVGALVSTLGALQHSLPL